MFARIPLTLFFMIKLLMTELQSFSRLSPVLSVVPMRLIGIIAALLTFNRPLGFVAIPGVTLRINGVCVTFRARNCQDSAFSLNSACEEKRVWPSGWESSCAASCFE